MTIEMSICIAIHYANLVRMYVCTWMRIDEKELLALPYVHRGSRCTDVPGLCWQVVRTCLFQLFRVEGSRYFHAWLLSVN
jgi:hypothetical protein